MAKILTGFGVVIACFVGCGDDKATGPGSAAEAGPVADVESKKGELYFPLQAGDSYSTEFTDTFDMEMSGTTQSGAFEFETSTTIVDDSDGTTRGEVTGLDESSFARPVIVLKEQSEETIMETLSLSLGTLSESFTDTTSLSATFFSYLSVDEDGVMFWGSREEGGDIERTESPITYLPGEVKPGDTWTVEDLPSMQLDLEDTDFEITYGSMTASAERIEKVTVPAGTFDALKAVFVVNNLQLLVTDPEITMSFSQVTLSATQWYAEGVGLIKLQLEMAFPFTMSAETSSEGTDISMSATGDFNASRTEKLVSYSTAGDTTASAKVTLGSGFGPRDHHMFVAVDLLRHLRRACRMVVEAAVTTT